MIDKGPGSLQSEKITDQDTRRARDLFVTFDLVIGPESIMYGHNIPVVPDYPRFTLSILMV